MIRYKICGRLPNQDILRYYGRERVDCFVHASEKEGLPVVIMEAESAGIPIVATDAGGVCETIGENGILLPADASPSDIADALLAVLKETGKDMRALSRSIWEEKFDAVKNAKNFVESVCKSSSSGFDRVIIVTEGYPYYANEAPFLESELEEWLKKHDVTLIARIHEDVSALMEEECRSRTDRLTGSDCIHGRLTVIPYKDKWDPAKALKYIVRYPFDKRTGIERKCIAGSKEKYLIRYWESMKYYAASCSFCDWLDRESRIFGADTGNTLIYTYWNLQPTLGLCFDCGRFGNATIITRAHGYDWQDEQWVKSNRKPFAQTVDRLIDSIVFVSRTGMNRYIERYGVSNEHGKYSYSYLGSTDSLIYSDAEKSVSASGSADGGSSYRIVSCSDVIPLKRVRLIIDALAVIRKTAPDPDIEWVHFGDGPLRDELESYAAARLGTVS